MKRKRFDCVALQHEGALYIYEQTKSMTAKERVAWWKQQRAALPPIPKPAAKGRRARKTTAR
jgi:hypothetical protein